MKRVHIIITGAIVLAYCLVLAVQANAQTGNDHAVVQDNRGQPVLTESTGTCARTKWVENHDSCGAEVTETTIQKQVKRAVISQDERTVYFSFNVATLSPEAMNRLDTLTNDIKSQKDIKGARVVGFADHIGTPSYNEKLSKKGAEAVKNYMIAKGIVNASVAETRWFGAAMPATNCPNNLPRSELISCLQKDRRVEVEVDYTSEVVAYQ